MIRIGRWARLLGLFLVPVGAAAAAIAAAESAKAVWLIATFILLAVGVVVWAVGFVIDIVVKPLVLTATHEQALRQSAARMQVLLGDGQRSAYVGEYEPRPSFHAHFPTVGRAADMWDEFLDTRDRAVAEVAHRVKREVQTQFLLWTAPRMTLEGSDRVENLIIGATLARAERDELDKPFELGEIPLDTLDLSRGEDEADEQWVAHRNRATDGLMRLAQHSQEWPQAVEAASAFGALRSFTESALPVLITELQAVQVQALSPTKKCPACRAAAT